MAADDLAHSSASFPCGAALLQPLAHAAPTWLRSACAPKVEPTAFKSAHVARERGARVKPSSGFGAKGTEEPATMRADQSSPSTRILFSPESLLPTPQNSELPLHRLANLFTHNFWRAFFKSSKHLKGQQRDSHTLSHRNAPRTAYPISLHAAMKPETKLVVVALEGCHGLRHPGRGLHGHAVLRAAPAVAAHGDVVGLLLVRARAASGRARAARPQAGVHRRPLALQRRALLGQGPAAGARDPRADARGELVNEHCRAAAYMFAHGAAACDVQGGVAGLVRTMYAYGGLSSVQVERAMICTRAGPSTVEEIVRGHFDLLEFRVEANLQASRVCLDALMKRS
ncbi:hypothetical protein ON010_g1125 [Phytophthora cinnamomi]|nr:hypothetical protein ON010_g1125 [Phytophthora cinnamomi]